MTFLLLAGMKASIASIIEDPNREMVWIINFTQMGMEAFSLSPHVSRQGFLSQMGVVHHPKRGRLSGLACYVGIF